jgi:hypothetical protein
MELEEKPLLQNNDKKNPLDIKLETCEFVTEETNADAVETLVSAFIDDPSISYLFGYDRHDNSPDKVARIRLFFETMTSIHRFLDCIVLRNVPAQRPEATGKCVQLWLKPSYNLFTNFFSSGIIWAFLKLSVGDILRSLEAAAKTMWVEYKHVHHVEDRTFHLSCVGTHHDFQKQGLLKQVFVPMLNAIDALDCYAYLESTKEENVPVYEHYGFRVVETFELGFFNSWWFGTGERQNAKMWGMLRPPSKKEI